MDKITAQLLLRGGDKHYLAVPFSEKDEAKSRGARWDANTRTWYVPPTTSLYVFGKWLVGECRLAFDFLEVEREAERLAQEEWRALPTRRGL
ncbi:DUF5710 domain-containing protein [uncultured Devosia sp.]|uniref:DUF5710 domain-containing protein n=1 Tax=uncultured Devosia sp. TaxID=211434 RepID=UPI00260EF4AF|nr:DUF5710 domain-containing protein [uncultured Devosia sp.]